MSDSRKAFEKWADTFNTESDEWQDMEVDKVYEQGWRDSRQALKGEPAMWSLSFNGKPANHFTTYPTRGKAEDYIARCKIGEKEPEKVNIEVVPLYTHPASAATLQFGNGNLVVVDGSFDDMPAVFISPAIDLGNAPGTALSGKDAERRTDMLYGDETVLLFKTAEHASVVAGALIRGNYASNYRPSPGYRKAAQIGQTIGVLAKNKEGRVCAVTDLGRCTWLSEDVTGAGDGDE